MKYKVGDRVRIKSIDWYNENKNKTGFIRFNYANFIPEMSRYCGEILTINRVVEEFEQYLVSECAFSWTDEMIEGLAEEETSQNAKLVSERFSEYVNPSEVKYAQDTITKMLLQEANIPNEYILKDENGNVINATKIVLEKKKKEYPKTYEKCWYELKHNINHDKVEGYKSDILSALQKLLICRDAYWKIAGEEMGLGKPWEPDWNNNSQFKYLITCWRANIIKETYFAKDCTLAFPTPEMRDAFYENFKELIEICKELL